MHIKRIPPQLVHPPQPAVHSKYWGGQAGYCGRQAPKASAVAKAMAGRDGGTSGVRLKF